MVGAIDTSRFIQVGINGIYGKPVNISPFELEGHNYKNYEDTHFQLLREGIYMPTLSIFTRHFNNVIDARNGKKTLLFADGTKVPKSLVKDMYGHLTGPHIDIYGTGDTGIWTWLNAKFIEGNLETVIGIEEGELKLKTEKLKKYLKEEHYVKLSFNSQGLPTSRYSKQEYKPGKSIYFVPPLNGSVARFYANSFWADLYCDGGSFGAAASLGVFACAEVSARKKRSVKLSKSKKIRTINS